MSTLLKFIVFGIPLVASVTSLSLTLHSLCYLRKCPQENTQPKQQEAPRTLPEPQDDRELRNKVEKLREQLNKANSEISWINKELMYIWKDKYLHYKDFYDVVKLLENLHAEKQSQG